MIHSLYRVIWTAEVIALTKMPKAFLCFSAVAASEN
jgi:hypothetical protein